MPDIPTTEPGEITAGDYVQWKISDADYPATTYTLTYSLVKDGKQINITAAASGDDHLVTLAAATTALYTAGVYQWQAYMTADAVRYNTDKGTLEVLPNFAAQSDGYDDRSHARKVLDALEAVIEGRATSAQEEKLLSGEGLAKTSWPHLLRARATYKAIVKKEERIEARKNNTGHDGNILARL